MHESSAIYWESRMDWNRKCLNDISYTSKRLSSDQSFPFRQRIMFTEVYNLSNEYSRLPGQSGERVKEVIAAFCFACIGTGKYQCHGRTSLYEGCPLMRECN